jgi:uncharacterized damage-inducible protein DinB
MTMLLSRPAADEYNACYDRYITKVPDGDIVQILATQIASTLQLLESIPESKGDYRYAEGKWTVKESVLHVIDAERIFGYRALRIARGDKTPLPGFEQDDYVPFSRAGERTVRDIAEELGDVRRSSVALFAHLDEEAMSRRGTASNNPVTPRALAYIIAGHERHHVAILREKYLS